MISILAVTYQHLPHKLPVFVHSVLDQTYTDFELLLYHDGGKSDKDTPETVESYWKTADWVSKNNDPRIKFKSSEERIHLRDGIEDWGHTLRARGIEEAGGEFLCIQNGDNYLTPVYLERMYDKMEKEGLDLLCCDVLHNYAGAAFGKEPYTILDVKPMLNHIDIGCMMIRTDLAREVGFNDRSRGADGIFAMRLVAAGAKYGKINQALFIHN